MSSSRRWKTRYLTHRPRPRRNAVAWVALRTNRTPRGNRSTGVRTSAGGAISVLRRQRTGNGPVLSPPPAKPMPATSVGTSTPGSRYRMVEKLVSIGDDFFIQNDNGQRVFKVDGKALRL